MWALSRPVPVDRPVPPSGTMPDTAACRVGLQGVTTHGPYRSKIHPLLEKIKIVIRRRSRLLRLLVWHGVCCPRMWQFTWESRKKECFHIQTFIRSFWSTWKNKQRTEHNIIYLFSRQHITLENNKSQSMRKYQVWPDGLDDLIMVSKSSLPHVHHTRGQGHVHDRSRALFYSHVHPPIVDPCGINVSSMKMQIYTVVRRSSSNTVVHWVMSVVIVLDDACWKACCENNNQHCIPNSDETIRYSDVRRSWPLELPRGWEWDDNRVRSSNMYSSLITDGMWSRGRCERRGRFCSSRHVLYQIPKKKRTS